MSRDAGDDGVVGEEGIAVGGVVLDLRDAGWAVAADSPRAVDGEYGVMNIPHHAGIDGEDGAGATETVAIADEIADGDALATEAEAEGETADSGNALRDADAEEVLIGDGHDPLSGLAAKGWYAIGVEGVEEILPLSVGVGTMPERFIGLGA